MITNLVVVDPTTSARVDDPRGAWTFKHLMEDDGADAGRRAGDGRGVLTTFTHAARPSTASPSTPRPGMQRRSSTRGRARPTASSISPRRRCTLQAIVNRFDLRNLANGDAGEGRFVFAF